MSGSGFRAGVGIRSDNRSAVASEQFKGAHGRARSELTVDRRLRGRAHNLFTQLEVGARKHLATECQVGGGRVGESSSPQYRLYHLLILVLAHALRKFSRRQGSPVIEWVNIGITIGLESLLSAHEEVLSVCCPSPLYAWIY